MTKGVYAKVLVAGFALALGPAGYAQGTGEKHLKASFYGDFPLGTLAWIRDANTESQAKRFRRSFHVLRDRSCYEFPRRHAYWIAINHRDLENEGDPGFASIRLIYDLPEDIAESRLFLFRNKGWIADDGKELDTKFEASSGQGNIDTREFFVMHSASELSDVESRRRRHVVQNKTGGFHAYVERDSFDSWDYSYFLKDSELDLPQEGKPVLADILHQRFTVTAKKNSRNPVIFKLNSYPNWKAKGVSIIIDMPKALGMRDRVVKKIMFAPNKCPE